MGKEHLDAYSFCETVTAGPLSPWHIRPLIGGERKLGGGATTPALCGRTVAWDLNVPIDPHHLSHSCKECAEKYKRLLDKQEEAPRS